MTLSEIARLCDPTNYLHMYRSSAPRMLSFVVTVESLIYGQVAGWLVQVGNFRALITDLFADGTDVENLTA